MSIEDDTWEGLPSPPKRKSVASEGHFAPVTKKPKKKRRKSFKEEGDLDADRHVDLTISRLDSQLLADLLAKQTKRFAPQLSLIEHEERRVPRFLQICTAQALVNTTDWSEPRTLDTLPAFLRTYARPDGSSKDLSHAPTGKGIPHTIVVAGSALRAADLTRCLRVFQTETATVAKLFAKHIKISEAKSFVQKTRINIGAGTPTRIVDLFESGVLKVTSLQQLVVDCSYIDQKQRSILSMRELHMALIGLLNCKHVKDRCAVEENRLKIIFF